MNMEKIREIRGRSNEEPLKEVSVLQHLSMRGNHPNVITCTEVTIIARGLALLGVMCCLVMIRQYSCVYHRSTVQTVVVQQHG